MDESRQKSESDRSGWMISPPGERQISVSFALGEGLEMTAQMRAKLDEFVASVLNRDELLVQPLDCGPTLDSCLPFDCNLGNCKPLVRRPCYVFEACTIA